MLAQAASVNVGEVSSVTIWGNHSSTLVPDLSHTTVGTKAASSIVSESWIRSTFIPGVRQRGSQIIKARGKSSAASAALSAVSAMGALVGQVPENTLISMPVYSKGNPYGIDQNLIFSFPCRTGRRGVTIDPSMPPAEYLWKEVRLSEQELIEEREAVRHLFLTQ
jgi:malate/lactate dehydrogenase